MKGVLAAFVAQIAIITWRDVHAQKVLPLPADYVGAVGVYALLGAAGHSQAAPLASGAAWVLVWVNLLGLWDPTNPLSVARPSSSSSTTASPSTGISSSPTVTPGGPQGGTLAGRAPARQTQLPQIG